ncbi:TetR/AcrR family transcriptional regulator [Desulfatiferula olefinivorans]
MDKGRTRNTEAKTAPKTREPRQKRSIEKKQNIMAAAMTLFARKGLHAATSKDIAAEAGVATGSFYSYFPDKGKLLIDVLEIYLDDHFERIWTASAPPDGLSPRDLIRHYMENLLDAYRVAPGFHRETHVLRYSDPDVKALYDRETRRELDQIADVLSRFSDRIAVDDMEAAAIVIHSAAENLAHKITFMGTIDTHRLIAEFTDMIHRYLSRP